MLKSGAVIFSKAEYQVKISLWGYDEQIIPVNYKLNVCYFGNQNKIMTRIFILICLVLFTSCLSPKYFLDNDQIPNDFGKDNKPVFIDPSPNKRINNIIISAFEKYYKGPYSILAEDDVLRKSGYVFHAYI